uniref:Uncharacterized protein n=1 Tax=Timema bartmani TaxID=61472 RepID=A0A7R9F4W0_9NEOP|nr:unnamed protein product [Timema bartmani]
MAAALAATLQLAGLLACFVLQPVQTYKVSGESECGHVFLTLSSLWHLSTHDRGLVDREIELNWETTGCEEELPLEWVELFNTDPHTNTHSGR